jgi:hypothetical protein
MVCHATQNQAVMGQIGETRWRSGNKRERLSVIATWQALNGTPYALLQVMLQVFP